MIWATATTVIYYTGPAIISATITRIISISAIFTSAFIKTKSHNNIGVGIIITITTIISNLRWGKAAGERI